MTSTDKDSILPFLLQIPPFSSLSEDELQKTAEAAAFHFYPAETVIFFQGRTGPDCIHIIQKGEVELYYKREDQRTQVSILRGGDIFGGIALLMNGGIPFRTAKVVTDAQCLTVPAGFFLELCRNHLFFNRYFSDIFRRRMVDKSYAAIFEWNQAVQFLSGIIPFSFLPETETEKAALELSTLSLPKDTLILRQGISKTESLYIIRSGAVERYFEENTREVLPVPMGEGGIFGGISMLINHSVSLRSFRTAEDSLFYILPRQCFLDICRNNESFSDYFTGIFGKRMLDSSYSSIVAKTIQPGEESLRFLNQPLDSIYRRNLICCDSGTSVQEAAELMSRHKCSSILVRSDPESIAGIVTDSDFRRKVIAGGLDIRSPVERIMSFPLQTVSSRALVFEALMYLMQGNFKHIGVTDAEHQVIGIITGKDILTAQSQTPLFLIREISAAKNTEDLKQQYQLLPGIIQNLISNGAKSRNLTRLITMVSDAILSRIIAFALEKHGPPPCDFAFMVMGSEGRKEQTLKTDQDNALVFEDNDGITDAKSYFLKLGESVCTWLNDVGYDFCKGGIMAKNPQWCQPLSAWKNSFFSWIRAVEPEDLLRSSIFFDFRCAYGKSELVDDLRTFLMDAVAERHFFLRHMAENAQHFKVPIGFFRNFIVDSKGAHRDSFDIKKAMVPVVDFARIHALENGIWETNTQERLYRLHLLKKLGRDTYRELDQAYSFLMQLRFARQTNAVMVEKARPDNYINPKKLTGMEQTLLREVFSRISNMQKELRIRFSGA